MCACVSPKSLECDILTKSPQLFIRMLRKNGPGGMAMRKDAIADFDFTRAHRLRAILTAVATGRLMTH